MGGARARAASCRERATFHAGMRFAYRVRLTPILLLRWRFACGATKLSDRVRCAGKQMGMQTAAAQCAIVFVLSERNHFVCFFFCTPSYFVQSNQKQKSKTTDTANR